jgi:16S rRNA (uracil1498-N3)-methyltransferase
MKRTVVKFDAKKAKSKVARWQAIAEAAAKQSKRAVIPEVGEVVSFKEALREAQDLDHILVPYECAEDIVRTREIISGIGAGESVAVFIGPEGGIDEAEIEAAAAAGAKMITLGRRILRTETAAISTLAILMFMFETA